MKVWLDRLPPDYRRRFYANTAILVGLFASFIVIGRLGARDGTIAIEVLMAAAVLWSWIFPLIRLLQERASRAPFFLYAAWILAYAYCAAAFFVPWLPAVLMAAMLGTACMCGFYIVYRKMMFPSFFGGEARNRWSAIRAAQKAEREADRLG